MFIYIYIYIYQTCIILQVYNNVIDRKTFEHAERGQPLQDQNSKLSFVHLISSHSNVTILIDFKLGFSLITCQLARCCCEDSFFYDLACLDKLTHLWQLIEYGGLHENIEEIRQGKAILSQCFSVYGGIREVFLKNNNFLFKIKKI